MNFENSQVEQFTTGGTTFEFNYDRAEYLSAEIVDQYTTQLNNMAKKYKKAKKKSNKKSEVALDIMALHSEWHVKENDETLYLIFSDDDECFTDVTTENEYYPNPMEDVE